MAPSTARSFTGNVDNAVWLFLFDRFYNQNFTQISHRQIVARILFIYAKLNPGQGYVQGMNEIVGPLYYVFANDPKDNWSGKLVKLKL